MSSKRVAFDDDAFKIKSKRARLDEEPGNGEEDYNENDEGEDELEDDLVQGEFCFRLRETALRSKTVSELCTLGPPRWPEEQKIQKR